ncbi:MaoC family dehydratase [Aeromicrobium sp. CTD01-1L150]|uniref:MaoC family dehydratase n=1 Tax=Aeromicrobium sp. CTD01-1L150 TaxID=3341830 RepID=UPI0035BEF9AE
MPIQPHTSTSALLGVTGWFEDFSVGQKIRHARASTVDEIEGSFIAKQVMNTAQSHWNEHLPNPLTDGRVVFGLATGSLVLGLSAQDCTEHAVRELSYDNFQFSSPVAHMDTISAYTEVLDAQPSPQHDHAGVVTFRHYGVNQHGTVVFRGDRTALIKRKSHWSESA